MNEFRTKKIGRGLTVFLMNLLLLAIFSVSALAASPYEVTKSGGALVRTSYAESASSVRREAQGNIVWVASSKKNSAGNLWYKLTDGYWIFSGNVKSHSCSWTWVSGTSPTCTSSGVTNYRCNKCGQTKKVNAAAYGHKYESNVCKTCGVWNTSSLKSRTYLNNVKYYVTTNGAKVHSGPYGGCATVATLYRGNEIYVAEKLVNASNNTWYRYSGGYIFSDYVVAHNSCSWNSGNVTKKATCTSTGTKVQNCTICGKSKTTTIAKLSHSYADNVCKACGTWNTSSLKSKTAVNNVKYYVTTNGAKVHSGPYGGCATVATLYRGNEIYVTEKLVNASNNTWYRYSGGYIFSDYVVAHNSCSWNSGSVTKKATCTSTGTKVQNCTICGKSKTTTIAKLSHSYADNVCKACGTWNTSSLKSKTAVSNVKYYVLSDGAKVHSGPYSGCKTVKTLSRGTEIVVTEKVVNASKNTWYRYSGGYIFSDYVVAHNSCSWNSGSVTKKATCTSTGTKAQKCKICGKSKTTTLSKTSHKYEDNVCAVCGSWNTASLKSKSAVSNVKYYVLKDGAKVHSGPYGGCKTVKTLSKGTEIVVTEKVVNASKNTWYRYNGGYIFSDYVAAHDSCSWNSGSVTKKATCKNTGTKVQKCKACGKSKTTTLSKTSHKYEDNVCTVCGSWNTASLKSKSAVSNVKYCVVSDSAKVHSGPYGGCKTVKTLKKGTEIVVTEKVVNASKNTWYKYKDGYIYGKYVKDYALYTAKTTLNKESATVYVKQKITLKATVKGPSSDVIWTADNPSVAVVDGRGNVIGLKSGSCTVTASANGKKDTCKITVKQLSAPTGVKIKPSSNGRTFSVSHKAVSGADGYEVVFRGLSGTDSKFYPGTSASVSVTYGKDCEFECYVRAFKVIDGEKYYGKSSKSVKIHVHNAEKNTSTAYSSADYKYHTVSHKFTCVGCKKKITETVTDKRKHSLVCDVCKYCGQKRGADYAVAKFYPEVGNGPVYSVSEKNDKGKAPVYVAVKFDDAQFKTDNTARFNSYLCRLSAIGATASYNKSFAKEFLKNCGFKTVEAQNSSSESSTTTAGKNDHARYIIGHKNIKGTNTTLVAVLVNGYTSGRYEWISNFNVGKSGLHQGFSKASDEVAAKINKYISDNKINSKKIKIWITGHSRGGAVTGMTAVKLNKKYGAENVFAYGFATPNGVPNDIAKKTYSKNIFNIVNPGDFVPYVVPSSWGFTKFGSTYEISVGSKEKSLYKALSNDSYDGLTEKERKSQITAFCTYSPSRKAYYTENLGSSPSDFGRALGLTMSKAGFNWEAAGLLAGCGISDSDSVDVLGKMVKNGKMTTKIAEAHCMETYMAMVYTKYS